jgi:hypothetical protein
MGSDILDAILVTAGCSSGELAAGEPSLETKYY